MADDRKFLLTRPLRDVTAADCTTLVGYGISTHTPLTGRDIMQQKPQDLKPISTHTPLTGRDHLTFLCSVVIFISTHTPLTGRDKIVFSRRKIQSKFLLTRPLRDVTSETNEETAPTDISTHTPLTGRDH